MLGQLTDTEIRHILTTQVVGRLACADGDQPYIVPVTFTYDGEYIYGQSNEGRKLEILRTNPAVCFETGVMQDMKNWQSVLVFGEFEVLDGRLAEQARLILFEHIFPLQTSSTIHPYGHETPGIIDDGTRIKHVMYRILIKKVTGIYEKN